MPQCSDAQSFRAPVQTNEECLASWRKSVRALCLVNEVTSGLGQLIAGGRVAGRLAGKDESNALTPGGHIMLCNQPTQRHEVLGCGMLGIISDRADFTESNRVRSGTPAF